MQRMIARGVVKSDRSSPSISRKRFRRPAMASFIILKPDLQEKIKQAFFSFPWKSSALAEEFGKSGEAKFIPITFKKDWEVIRKIDAATNVSYNCN